MQKALVSFLLSFKFAGRGALASLKERNMRVHLTLFAVALGLSIWLGLDLVAISLILAVSSVVMVSEIINTCVEKAMNIIAPEYHPLAALIKDLAAGAVLIASGFALAVGIILIGVPLYAHVFGHN
jgi:diacylglycerol kinase (ATP)